MTEQYARQNINDPAGARSVASDPSTSFIIFTPSDAETLIVADTSAGPLQLILPLANSVTPGTQLTFVARNGGTNSAEVVVDDENGIVVPSGSSATMSTDNASRTVVSDGGLIWYIVDGLD